MLVYVLSLFALFNPCSSFGFVNPVISHSGSVSGGKQQLLQNGIPPQLSRQHASSTSSLKVQIDADLITEMSNSRITFWLCFFGATGSAAVGRAAIPKTIKSIKLNQSLAGQGNSLGGEDLGLIGYPETIYREDVEKVLNNDVLVDDIVAKYPIPNRMPNMLQYESFAMANPDANPLAIRAVFDSLVVGINKNSAAPEAAQENIIKFRTDLDALKKQNNVGKAIGIFAFFFLLSLIGGADWFAFYHGWKGWFPLWPGLSNFPASLFDGNIGVTSIPKYWMGEIPEIPM